MTRRAWVGVLGTLAIGPVATLALLEFGARLLPVADNTGAPAIQIAPATSATVVAPVFAENEGDINSIHDPDPWVWWRVKPNLRDFHVRVLWDEAHSFLLSTDASGFRLSPNAPDQSARRILVVGDSTAFGVGVGDGDTWPSRLRKAMPEDTQVINAGVPGHSTFQAMRMAEKYGMDPKPSLVIVCAGFNDSGLVPSGELPDLARAHRNESEQAAAESPSHLMRLLARAVTGAQRLQSSEQQPRLTEADLRETLTAADAYFKEQQIPLLWVRWPTQSEVELNQPPSGGYPHILLEHAAKPGVHLVDMLDPFKAADPSPYYDFVHASAQGNALAATAIAEALAETSLR